MSRKTKGHGGGDYTLEACRDPAAKQATRQRAIELAKQSPTLWSPSRGTLRCDWLELAGAHAPTLQTLLDQKALPTSGARFIGVDTDPNILQGCKDHYGPNAPALWIKGNVTNIIAERQHQPTLENVGVLVYDSHDLASQEGLPKTLKQLGSFAEKQRARLGGALLIINVVGDPRWTNKNDYARVLSEVQGHPVEAENIHEYRSNTTPMWWIALTYGF